MAVDEGPRLKDRPAGELVGDLMRDLSLLVRQEVSLAKAEMREKGKTVAPGLGMIGAAGVAGLCAAGALTATAILVLALFLPDWASALLVGAALAGLAALLALRGKEQVADAGAPVPEQTMDTVKEDVEWMKARARSGRT